MENQSAVANTRKLLYKTPRVTAYAVDVKCYL